MVRIFIAALSILALFAPAEAAQLASSKALLLSPHAHQGKSFKWIALAIDREVATPGSYPNTTAKSLSVRCEVLTGNANSFILSREIQAFVDNSGWRLPRQAGRDVGHWISLGSRPSIVIKGGRAWKPDGKPLYEDPLCLFYSASWFGTPPEYLTTGTSWNFRTPTWIPSANPDELGTATVTRLDATRGEVTLHVALTAPKGKNIIEQFQMTIIDGGVITTEVRQMFLGTREDRLYYETDWNLQGAR
jgi:hypothetical protein